MDDRDALLDAMADQGFDVLEGYLLRSLHAPTPEDLFLAFLEFALEHPTEFDIMFLTSRQKLRRYPSDFEQRRSTAFRMVCEEVQRFMREGVLKVDDPLEATLTLWAHAHGLISMYFVGRFGRDRSAFRALYLRSIERVLKGLLK
jgi:AcrR family transcriptional regulator